jgi:catechol 2,3-dioxygenase-like lactoylglutathione lyase family enzyme
VIVAPLPVIEPVVKVHVSLNVTDLGRSVDFYRVLFGAEPAKRHDDYAKFELEDPPVVFSLVPRAPGPGGSLSHLGFRVAGTTEVRRVQERLAAAGVCTQEQNGTACGGICQDKVWVQDPDGNFWEVTAITDDGAPAVVRRDPEAAAPPGPSAGPLVWEHYIASPLDGPIPHADDSVDEVRLTGTFNAALDEAARSFVVREAFRVLRAGGKVVTHGLMADRPLPGAQPKLPGLAAMVARVPARDEPASLLRSAGFVGVQWVKLTESPWFVHDGVGLREAKVVAWKPVPAEEGGARPVLYKGPFAEATADGGWVFPRGRRVPVPPAVWHQLRLGATAEQFVFFESAAGACAGGR